MRVSLLLVVRTLLTIWLVAFSGMTLAADSRRVSLLELYTSEGCNSCPPADRWVSSLPRPQLVPGKLVVLAFHVDYWNYLGWTDRFSQRRFTNRQQAMVRVQNLRTAYTPQLLLNGRDYRRHVDLDRRVEQMATQTATYRLNLDIQRGRETYAVRATATASDKVAPEPAEFYVAIYENNLTTEVRAGENRGEQLRHDYVVRTLIGPLAIQNGSFSWSEKIAIARDWKPGDLGVAAFVQSTRTGEVLQAIARE